MALGGGTFVEMDKTLAGAYINTISAPKDVELVGKRGVVAIAIEHSFGNQGEMLELTPKEFTNDSLIHLGYKLYDDKLKGLRELFANSSKVLLYVLNKTTKASNSYATSKKGGTRGNEITIKVQTNVDEPNKKDVITMLDYTVIDKQTVKTAAELSDNALVVFKKDSNLEETVGSKLSGGTDGTVTNAEHNDFLSRLETKYFNVISCMATTKQLQKLYIEYTRRMRNDIGKKIAVVLCEASDIGSDANFYDFEGNIVVKNKVKGSSKNNELVPFTSAIYASVEYGKSNLNKEYTGEYEIITDFTQYQLTDFIKQGRFVYHDVNGVKRVLEDINGLVTVTDEKGAEFKENQVVRIVDELAKADALVFNTMYLGKVNIDKAGIESYKNKLIDIREKFVNDHALVDFDRENLTVEKVEGVRGAIKVESAVTPAECFRQLYLTNIVKTK